MGQHLGPLKGEGGGGGVGGGGGGGVKTPQKVKRRRILFCFDCKHPHAISGGPISGRKYRHWHILFSIVYEMRTKEQILPVDGHSNVLSFLHFFHFLHFLPVFHPVLYVPMIPTRWKHLQASPRITKHPSELWSIPEHSKESPNILEPSRRILKNPEES